MKTLRASLPLLLLVGSTALAQPDVLPSVITLDAPAGAPRSVEQLEQLVAPIALYPDALVALILPASVASTDVVLAARQLRDFPNDRSQIEHRGWDESVKALTSYPEVLQWLDQNLPWTKQLGEAFAQQPAELMQAIQRLRTRARAAGTLVDTPQQVVVAEPNVIRIVPAQPDIVYVPRYEPEIVFVREPVYYARPLLTFGIGVRAGAWLANDCDWNRRTIWLNDRHRPWHGHDWRRPLAPVGVRPWMPPARHVTNSSVAYAPRPAEIVRPTTIGSAPAQPRTWTRSGARMTPPPVNASAPSPAPVNATSRTYVPRPSAVSPRAALDVTPPLAAMPPVTAVPPPALASVPQPPTSPRPDVPRADGRPPRTHVSSAIPHPPHAMGPQPAPGYAPAPAPHMTTRSVPASRPEMARAAPAPATAPAPAPASAVTPGTENASNSAPARPPENTRGRGRRGENDAQR